MEITHCGDLLDFHERRLKPTVDEASRGVTYVLARQYWCQQCRKKLYYKQENFDIGSTNWQRVKRSIGAFVARLKQAKESDWVWGYNKETFGKIKVTVR